MLALAGAATGCEEDVEKLEKAKLEQTVKKSLAGKRLPFRSGKGEGELAPEDFSIRCPGDVEAKVGARTRCTFVDLDGGALDGSESDVSVRVRAKDADEYRLAIKVGSIVRVKIKKAELQQGVKEILTEQKGQAPKAVRCPDDIKAKVGAKIGAKTRCTFVDLDDSELDVNVRVINVTPVTSKFTYRVAIKVGNE